MTLALALLLIALGLAALSAPDEATLIRQLRDGSESAFRRIFERDAPRLRAFVARRVSTDPDAPDDLVQDAFVRLWNHRTELDPALSVRAYLYRTAHNLALNWLRDRSTRGEVHGLTGVEDDAVGFESTFPTLAADDPSALDHAVHGELSAALDAAIRALPAKRQEVFRLAFVDGLRHREIAEMLGLSASTVENQVGAALKTVRRALARFA